MAYLLTIDELTPSQRNRGLLALLLSSFFSQAGFFLVIPLMAVHYVDHLGWAAGTIGLVLAVRQFTQQGLSVGFGLLADRVGPRILILAGMFTRVLGFIAMAWAVEFVPVLLAALVIALGGAMFDSPISAAIASLTYPDERRRYYARLGMVGGAGVTVGTQVGALLIGFDFALVCLGGAAAFFVIFLVMIAIMPPVASATDDGASEGGIRLVLSDFTFLRYISIVAGYWFAWTQFGLTITLAAVAITGTDKAVSWIYLVNAAITIGLGYTLPRVLEKWLTPLQMQVVGIGVLAGGLLLVGVAQNVTGILFAAGVFALGAVMARPGQDTVLANLSRARARGAYFGIAGLALAFGGGFGNYFGGVIYDLGGDRTSSLPWIIFSCVAAVTAILLWINRVRFSVVRT